MGKKMCDRKKCCIVIFVHIFFLPIFFSPPFHPAIQPRALSNQLRMYQINCVCVKSTARVIKSTLFETNAYSNTYFFQTMHKFLKKRKMPDSPADSRSMASKLAKSISHRDHVLLRPELHIGPTNKETALLGTVSGPGQRIPFASHSHIPGLSTILDEILVNVCDHRIRIAGSPLRSKPLP